MKPPQAYQPVPPEAGEPVQGNDTCRKWIICVHVLCTVVMVAIFLLILRREPRIIVGNMSDPFLASYIAPQAFQCGCPRLGIFPFDTACPANCTSHRIGMKNANFYKTSSAFVFGKLQPFRQQESPNEFFQGGARVAQTFIAREKAVIESVIARVKQANLPPLSVHRQSIMHISVDYLCCLTDQEKEIAQDVRSRFVAEHYNNFPLELGDVQCFHERRDSVTLIWMADALSQQLALRANRALANAMRAKGVPVLVDRSLQMPFHSTLVGFKAPRGEDISKYRKAIHAGVVASGSHTLKTHVNFRIQLGKWELSLNSTEANYPTFLNVENAKWYVREQCGADFTEP